VKVEDKQAVGVRVSAKDQKGVATPKKVLIKRDGKKYLEAEVLEFKVLEELDNAEFQK
jgi:hypothetical protein